MSDTSENKKSFVGISEVASFLGVPTTWIYQRTHKKTIPCIRLGKYVRFDLEKIKTWAEQGCPANFS